MPLYDFICRNCGCAFEALVMGSDKPACPKCKSGDLAKQMSTFAARTGDKGTAGGAKCSGCAGKSCSTCH
ncbi:FmdB family zinc ribbon protein [Thiovibrio sp. JS02]